MFSLFYHLVPLRPTQDFSIAEPFALVVVNSTRLNSGTTDPNSANTPAFVYYSCTSAYGLVASEFALKYIPALAPAGSECRFDVPSNDNTRPPLFAGIVTRSPLPPLLNYTAYYGINFLNPVTESIYIDPNEVVHYTYKQVIRYRTEEGIVETRPMVYVGGDFLSRNVYTHLAIGMLDAQFEALGWTIDS